MSLDRLPPHSIEAEQGFLGSILLDPKTALAEARSNIAEPESFFYDLRHAVIFKTACELSDENIPVDLVTLSEKLKGAGKLDQVGGISYLSALPDATPSAANLDYYAGILEEKASLRRLLQACQRAISNVYENGSDAESIISQAEREILSARQQRKSKTPETKELVREALSEIERLHQQQGAIGGISTGLSDLDYATDGLHAEEMLVISGFPGSGKSALAMNIAEHVAIERRKPVGVFSLEMGAKRLVMRMIASGGRVNLRSIRDGKLCAGDFPKIGNAASRLSASPLHFCDLADLTISQLRAKARQMVQQFDVKMFVVDYLQLLTAPGKKDQNREQEVSAISRGLKLMACEFKVPVLALSQLNEDGKLRESRSIGQDADSVWRLKAKEEEAANKGGIATPMQIEILKQRDGEAPKIVDLVFLKPFTRFECATTAEPPIYDKD